MRPIDLDLPCPECRQRGLGGKALIGNRRDVCSTCNTFARMVDRQALVRLKALHPVDHARIRRQVVLDRYPMVLEAWAAAHAVDPAVVDLTHLTHLTPA